VQSFHDASLRWMHRSHDAHRVATAVETIVGAGITNWSLDLIFALPAALGRDWAGDLRCALALRPPHVSAYGLTLEQHTPFARWTARGVAREADESDFEEEFLAAHDILESAGYTHYEVSNYALPGAESRHNSAYWRRASYAGLGPSAHSFEPPSRRWNEREYAAWLRRVLGAEDPVSGTEELSSDAVELEVLYLGLRTRIGVQIGAADRPLVARWLDAGWAREESGRLVLTPIGWLRIDALASALTEFRSHL
jgi:oxygen-independent coproporphyrinogen-3 oxidase